MPEREEVIELAMDQYKLSREATIKKLQDEHDRCTFWVNDLYQVQVSPCGPDDLCLHINIRRRDGATDLRDWRHFQQIKNEVAGLEREAIELFPAESRKVDTSNKWHLWVLPEGTRFGLGWVQRDVSYEENKDIPGMRQRAL
jgi:hypothetical protein